MSNAELIDELTDICTRQAEIIKALAYELEQFGALKREAEIIAENERLKKTITNIHKT